MRRHRVSSAVVVFLLAVVTAGTALAQVPAPADYTLYLRNDGADCGAASRPFIAPAPGSDDLGCGYVGGLPFGEVFAQLGTDTAKLYPTDEPLALLLDGMRDVTGQITVTPYAGAGDAGTGVGEIVVEVSASAYTTANKLVDLGSASISTTATPVASRQVVPFTLPIADELDGTEIKELTLSVNIRGVHVAHGFNELNGESFVKVPFREPVIEPTPTETAPPAP